MLILRDYMTSFHLLLVMFKKKHGKNIYKVRGIFTPRFVAQFRFFFVWSFMLRV